MIVGLVGTHGAPFKRLVHALDVWAATHPEEEVVIQAGPAVTDVVVARAMAMTDAASLERLVDEARVVVSHGGPSLLLRLIDQGRIPIVMPREARYGEHVDDHQVEFADFLGARGLAIVIRSETDLYELLDTFEARAMALHRNPLEAADPSVAARRINSLLATTR